ncbi:hypothetical protein KAI58_03590 [Candidatus Gracilibacteria bacterium]|nr:hypothetical protein [Candidatus Gracilibacteria bacterium]
MAVGNYSLTNNTGGADNLGNHTVTQNIKLNGNWLSGDGGNEGVFVKNDGKVGIGTTNPSNGLKLEVEGKIGATKYCDENGSNCVEAESLGGGGVPASAAWYKLVSTSAETYSWVNNNSYPVHVSATGGQDSGNTNGCSLKMYIDGVLIFSDSNANPKYSKSCGGYLYVPAGATLKIVSNPWAGSGSIRAYVLR